ncbi:MAG TPA: hypothetical protein VJ441_01525, partial [Dehalococcoidia bacterium]|nr:hypothetical protein [Dehalococcoidia bacterium]
GCHFRQIFLKRRHPRIFDIPIPVPFGVSLIEILAVVLILGMLSGITIPSIMYLRQKALETELTQLFYANRDTDLGILAAQAISISEEGQLLEDIPQLSQIKPEELEQLEHKLTECLGFDTDALKIGAAIKAIEEWQRNLESYQFDDDFTPSTPTP